MEFGISTWVWTSPFQSSTIELFPRIKKMGYDYVEIPIEDPGIIDAGVVKQALDDQGLKPITCGAFGPSRDLASEEPQLHQNCFDYLRDCFEICNVLGASFLVGPMYSAVGKARLVPPNVRQEEWNRAVDNLNQACKLAAEQDIDLALEPINRFETDMVNTSDDVLRMIQDIDHPNAKIALDSFHMTLEERDLQQAFLLVKDHLIHVQVSENYRGIPGTGQTRWDHILAGLRAIDYQGVVSIESFTPHVQELAGAVCIWKPFANSQDEFAEQGLDFLKNLFEQV